MHDGEIKKVIEAANNLRALSADLNQAIIDLREYGIEDQEFAYARVYELRAELGKIVASLGQGKPPSSAKIREKSEQVKSARKFLSTYRVKNNGK